VEINQENYKDFRSPLGKNGYPQIFTKGDLPFCRWGASIKLKGIEYERKKTHLLHGMSDI